MHFNSFVGGLGRQDLSPVCKRRGGSPTSASATVTSSAEIKEIDISTLPEQLQQMLQNLDVSNVAEIDVSEIMSKLAGNLAKMKPKVPEKARPEPKREPTRESYEYVKLVNGAPGCPVGSEILTFEECRDAILSLGQKPDPYWNLGSYTESLWTRFLELDIISHIIANALAPTHELRTNSFEGLPRHCSLRDRPGEVVGLERMHFNTANRGTGRDDLAPICRKQGQLLFVLASRVSHDDVGVERQIRALLDPPTLPSAMLLQGGNQPKFMLAHHREEDEEALAVRDEERRAAKSVKQ
eukprot:g27324.t1